jgi:hypothetical protein
MVAANIQNGTVRKWIGKNLCTVETFGRPERQHGPVSHPLFKYRCRNLDIVSEPSSVTQFSVPRPLHMHPSVPEETPGKRAHGTDILSERRFDSPCRPSFPATEEFSSARRPARKCRLQLLLPRQAG